MIRGCGRALVATVAMTAGVLVGPGAAHAADRTTSLSAAQMTAALKAVATTTTAAARRGWQSTMQLSSDGITLTDRSAYDPAHGVAFDELDSKLIKSVTYAVSGVGVYEYAGDRDSRRAMAMIGRPAVRYILVPSRLKLSAWSRENLSSPADSLAEDTGVAGRKITHSDGSADFVIVDDGTTAVLHVDPDGVITTVRGTGAELSVRLTYSYGVQHLQAPSAGITVSPDTMTRALAYLDMRTVVRGVAEEGAEDAHVKAHGHTVTVSALRTAVRRRASASNAAVRASMVTVTDLSGGAKVSARNPWTHATVTFTVKTAGRKVVITG
jgi:hypothetical protein